MPSGLQARPLTVSYVRWRQGSGWPDRFHVPQTGVRAFTSRGQRLPVGAEGYAIQQSFIFSRSVSEGVRLEVPEDGPITYRDQDLPIRAEDNTQNSFCVSFQGLPQRLEGLQVPEDDGLVLTYRGQDLPIWAEGNAPNPILRSFQGRPQGLTGIGVPENDGLILTCSSQNFVIRTENQVNVIGFSCPVRGGSRGFWVFRSQRMTP